MGFWGGSYWGPSYWGGSYWGGTGAGAVVAADDEALVAIENLSEVAICNSALQKIGVRRILAFAQESDTGVPEAAKIAAHQYPLMRDLLYEMHHWNFAIKRKQLTQTTTPVFEYDYAYALPDDWIRVVAVHRDTEGHGTTVYKREGATVVMNSEECWMTYVSRVTDPAQMTPDFRELLSTMLAREFAIPLADSLTLHDMMDELFETELIRVSSADAIEDYPESFPESTWITTRQDPESDPEGWGWGRW